MVTRSLPRASQHFIHFLTKRVERRNQKLALQKGSPSVPLFSMVESPSAPTLRLPSGVNSVKARKSEHARALLARAKLEVIIAKADLAGRVTLFSPYKRSLNG